MTKSDLMKLGDEFSGTLPGVRRLILVFCVLANLFIFYALFITGFLVSWSYGVRQDFVIASSVYKWGDLIVLLILGAMIMWRFVSKRFKKNLDRHHLYLANLLYPDDMTLPISDRRLPTTPLLLALGERQKFPSAMQWEVIAPFRLRIFSSFFLALFTLLSSGFYIPPNDPSFLRNYHYFNDLYGILCLVVLLISSTLLILAWIGNRRLMVAIDNDGLWIRTLGWQKIPWNSIRTIGVVPSRFEVSEGIGPETLCVIMASNGFLMWRIPDNAQVEVRETINAMMSLILQSTGLPLRDLTQLEAFKEDSIHDVSDYAQLLSQKERLLPKTWGKRSFFAWSYIGLGLSILLVFPGTHLMYDVLQPVYFTSLPSQLHARVPVIKDPLETPGLLSQPSQGTGVYMLAGSRYGTYGVYPDSYGNVAIEAFVKVQGPGTAGVATRVHSFEGSDELYNGCYFGMMAEQHWISTCNELDFDMVQGHDPAIQNGSNKLLLLAHGVGYALYINDHYVGFLEDQYGIGAGLTGHVGLFCLGENTTCTFSSVLIWPLSDNSDVSWLP